MGYMTSNPRSLSVIINRIFESTMPVASWSSSFPRRTLRGCGQWEQDQMPAALWPEINRAAVYLHDQTPSYSYGCKAFALTTETLKKCNPPQRFNPKAWLYCALHMCCNTRTISVFPSRTPFFFRQCSNMMEVSDVVLHHPPHIKSDQERTLKKYSLYLCLYLNHYILLFLSLLKLIWWRYVGILVSAPEKKKSASLRQPLPTSSDNKSLELSILTNNIPKSK